MDENSDNMHLLYIQKQEQLLVENMRSKVDYEIKLHILSEKNNNLIEQIKQMQHAFQNQQDIGKQAIDSFERVTNENNMLKSRLEEEQTKFKEVSSRLEQKIRELETGAHELTTKVIQFSNERSNYEKQIKDLQIEINRQTEELERLHNNTNSKQKKKKSELLVEQSTDSGTF